MFYWCLEQCTGIVTVSAVCLQRRSRYVMLRTTSRWIKMVNVIDCWNPSDCLYIPFHWISCAITSKQHVAFYVWITFYAAVVYIYNELTVLPVYAASFRYKTDALQRQHEFAIYFPVLDWCIAFYFIVLQTFLSVCLSVCRNVTRERVNSSIRKWYLGL